MNEENDMETTSSHEQLERKAAVSAPSTAPKEQPKQPPGLFPIVALCLAVSFGASLATIIGYDRWYAQKIVAVDIKGYIFRPLFTTLQLLHNLAAYQPIGNHHVAVDRTHHIRPRPLQNGDDTIHQICTLYSDNRFWLCI